VPELPEVEVLARHLDPLLRGKVVRAVQVLRPKSLRTTSATQLKRTLKGGKFGGVTRRGKYLLFSFAKPGQKDASVVLGHLGMTGRMYLVNKNAILPRHGVVALDLGRQKFVFEDTRYFGSFTLETRALKRLGAEPLGPGFNLENFGRDLKRSKQRIKIKLLDQGLVAGIGNIYASEILFRARVSPNIRCARLKPAEVKRIWAAIREVLAEAIRFGSTVPLSYNDNSRKDGLFYFGRSPETPNFYEEKLRVYDRAGQPCPDCGTPITRLIQAARSTFYCKKCQ
jgi:formamidopyrimidine-DNA glycosylase